MLFRSIKSVPPALNAHPGHTLRAHGEVSPHRSSSFERVWIYVQSMVGPLRRRQCVFEVGRRRGARSGSAQTDLLGGSASAENRSARTTIISVKSDKFPNISHKADLILSDMIC